MKIKSNISIDTACKSKLRIGVITVSHSRDNYGQILQVYALQYFLRKMGHDAFLIRYNPMLSKKSIRQQVIRLIKVLNYKRLKDYMRRLSRKRKYNREAEIYPRYFDRFMIEHIVSTPEIYSDLNIKCNPPHADVYICGSDQIWGGLDDIFYLNFGSDKVRRIAYAPSFGGRTFSKKDTIRLTALLKKFEIVTVRETDGIEKCYSAGRADVKLVPDPTMLLAVDEYRKLAIHNSTGKKYLLLYLVGNQTSIDINSVYSFAKGCNLEVYYVASQMRVDRQEKVYPTIEEWLGLISDAEYVVTNSFHGCVFSILFNKKFLVAKLSDHYSRMNSRIDTLLKDLGLENRILTEDITKISFTTNYNEINETIKIRRQEIKEFFENILS